MKKLSFILSWLLVAAVSCESLDDPRSGSDGAIRVSFVKEYAVKSVLPDTNRFILSVTDASGQQIYKGEYGAAPETIIAAPGSYTVSAVSVEFDEPLFESPQYGDSQVVLVRSGQTTCVVLDCAQLNSGLTLVFSEDFKSAYPQCNLYLKSSDGTLMYDYYERRVAYFKPGAVSLVLVALGAETVLFTKVLEARQVLSVSVSCPSSDQAGSGVSLRLDTSRFFVSEAFEFRPEEGRGSEVSLALSVPDARVSAGLQDVWVCGYIVGGDLTSSKCSFDAPFSARTNLVLASKSSCRDKSQCLSVQLSQGDIREALNLVDHPSNLGRQVLLKGDIVSAYYGIPGLQSLEEYEWR